MSPILSVYLDIVRIVAALIVLLSHTWALVLPNAPYIPLPGHYAVIIFFVLSGFVIAFVTDTRESDVWIYTLNRLSRLWSVAIPAVFLGALVQLAGGGSVNHMPTLQIYPDDLPGIILRGAANVLFVAQNWSVNLVPGVNGPFWSLNYEAWYYMIFGACRYLHGWLRLPVTALLLALAGPKIVLLMPCWLVGVWLYRYRTSLILSPPAALVLTLVSLGAIALLLRSGAGYEFRMIAQANVSVEPALIINSSEFPIDFVVALLFAFHLHAVQFLAGLNGMASKAAKSARTAASFTFSTYLYHLPIFVLLWDLLGIHHMIVYLILPAVVVCLGIVTEHRRSWLRARLARCFDRVRVDRV